MNSTPVPASAVCMSVRQLTTELSRQPLSEAWSERVSMMERLCAQFATTHSAVTTAGVAGALATQLGDRRSCVIKALCAQLCELCAALPAAHFEELLLSDKARLLRALLRLLMVTVGAIKRPANACVTSLLCEGEMGARLRSGESNLWPAVRAHLAHRHPVLRRHMHAYLLRLCEEEARGSAEDGRLPAHLLRCAGKAWQAGLTDAEPGVRQATVRCVRLLREEERERFMATLSIETRRKLVVESGEVSDSAAEDCAEGSAKGGQERSGKSGTAALVRKQRRRALLKRRKRALREKHTHEKENESNQAAGAEPVDTKVSAGGGVLMIF
jgi:hypothetical protein